jgi:hypothetical protein
METARTLAYIDVGLSDFHACLGSDAHKNDKRSMEYLLAGWSRKNHTFDSVTVSANLAARFTKGAQNSFEDVDGNKMIGSLGFSTMARNKDTGLVMAMSADDKLRNAVFNSMVKKAWGRAVVDVRAALDADGGKAASSPEADEKRQRIAMRRGLWALSKAVEDDAEAVVAKAKADLESRRSTGRAGHGRWVENKEKYRIRLPKPEEDDFKDGVRGRMDCTVPKNTSFRVIKQMDPLLQTSADMVRSMGVGLMTGVAYALTGSTADLERSRKQLVSQGHIFRENFADPETGEVTPEGDAAYRTALAAYSAKVADAKAATKKQDRTAFHGWVETKEGAELARECMSIMSPTLCETGGGGETGPPRTEAPLLGRPPTDDEFELWRAVGYANKAIDRALLTDWIRWSAPLFGRNDCVKEWGSFKPMAHAEDMAAERATAAAEEAKKVAARAAEDRALGLQPKAPVEVSDEFADLYKPPKAIEREKWMPADRGRALELLHLLSVEQRKLHKFKLMARNEKAPVLPVLRRMPEEEALPTYLHGHEGSVRRLTSDLAQPEGKGLAMLGGSGVGSELVLSWLVGEDDVVRGVVTGAAGRVPSPGGPEDEERGVGGFGARFEEGKDGEMGDTGVEGPSRLLGRMRSAASSPPSGPVQPPYVMVVETCGPAGGAKQRAGEWTRVLIDPPVSMPVLASSAGSGYVPLSAAAQGLCVPPPPAGCVNREWEANPSRLRGAMRVVGLLPNTSYCFRVRAYSRAGASPYAFGVFTTAPPPPPAPILALPTLVPRHLLASEGKEGPAPPPPNDLDALTLCWESRIDLRTGLLRLLRIFYAALEADAGGSGQGEHEGSILPDMMSSEGGGGGMPAPGAVFTYARADKRTLLQAIGLEVGLRNWVASCVAAVSFWPARGDDEPLPAEYGDISRLPARFAIAQHRTASVLEALAIDSRAMLSWEEVVSMFASDAGGDDPFDVLLAGTRLGGTLGLGDESGAGAAGASKGERKPFALTGGPSSLVSQAKNAIKASMTIARPATAGEGRRTSSGGATPPRPPPVPALGRSMTAGGGGGDLTAQLALIRTRRRGSFSSSSSKASVSSAAERALATSLQLTAASTDVTVKYSLLQCLSDGAKGQEWAEIFVGIRTSRRVDKLLPGTGYSFKVQAINSDGQASHFGPPVVVTTALPPPQALRVTGRVSATSAAIVWEEVSSANALSTMRAVGAAPTGAAEEEGGTSPGGSKKPTLDPSKAADIDAVLEALLNKTKGAKAEAAMKKGANKKEGADADTFASIASSVAIREGDGGVGVDLARVWGRYTLEGSSRVPVQALRGLLADMGAYSETATLVNAAMDAGHAMSLASGEGATGAGPSDWRLLAAIEALDPRGTGVITFADFAEWWNSVDAAVAKSRGVSLPDQLEVKALAQKELLANGVSLRPPTGGLVGPSLGRDVVTGDLTFSIIYVLECRRLLTKAEATAVAGGAPLPSATGGARTPSVVHEGGTRAGRPTGGAAEVEEEEGGDIMAASARSARPPMPPTAGGAPSPLGASSASVGKSVHPNALMSVPLYTAWSVLYMGPHPGFKLSDLAPNGEYMLRVSALGRHASSNPSKTLQLALPPLAPFAPVLVKITARMTAVRWYPGELSADKFEVQVKMVDSLRPGSTSDAARLKSTAGTGTVALDSHGRIYTGRNISELAARRLATSRALGGTGAARALDDDGGERWAESPEESWATLYTGAATFAAVTGLFANSVYRMRIVAYNSAGVPSRPSVEMQLVTGDATTVDPPSVDNAARMFVVEAAASAVTPRSSPHLAGRAPLALQDVVLGDLILFTEDVFVDSAPDADAFHPAEPTPVPESHPRATFYCSRTVAASIISDSASRLTAGSGVSANIAVIGGPSPIGATAAAFAASGYLTGMYTERVKTVTGGQVVSVRPPSALSRRKVDAGVGSTDSGVRAMGGPSCMEDGLHARMLTLQVEWSTVSKSRAGAMVFAHGSIIKRRAVDLAGLDMYRTLWADEGGRWSLSEEMRASYDA